MTAPLHLVRLYVDRTAMARALHDQAWFGAHEDLGQELHATTKALFGELAPKPFTIEVVRGSIVKILAYSRHSAESLHAHAERYADPEWIPVVDWSRLQSKPMPSDWSAGTKLDIHVRACPVVRNSQGKNGARREEDAYLSSKRRDPSISREEAYLRWGRAALERLGGLEVVRIDVRSHQRLMVVRRTQGEQRRHRSMERPEVVLHGTILVTDSAAFSAALARGLGRHRAFGFGMLLLRPPSC